jgi:Nitrogenase molybdenum-iron protein, alpha and beta chains
MVEKKYKLVYQTGGEISMSKNIIHKNRNGCALHGALKTINAVDGFAPVIHSSAGCSIQSAQSENLLNSSNGSYFRGWLETSATDVIEKQVVFGGTSRLREQIKNTVKVLAADLYVVVTGCAPEIVGDDVPAMVKEAHEQGFPVIAASTPGFKGNVYRGYEWTLKALIEYISPQHQPQSIEKGLVNLLGIVPKQDLFWEGNLDELEYTLSLAGLKTNKLFGYHQNIGDWRKIPHAELNLVVSPWGLETARLLEKKFGTPYLYLGYIPAGADDNSALLRKLGEKLNIEEPVIREKAEQEAQRLGYHLQKLAQIYLKYDLQKEIILVGETSNVTGLARFLQHGFGQIVKAVIITDTPAEEHRDDIADILNENPEYLTRVFYETDGREIDRILTELKPEVILASELEEPVSRQLNVPLLKISTPVHRKPFLNYSYAGYRGAVHLLQDFSEIIVDHLARQKQSKKGSDKVPFPNNELKTIFTN